MLGKNMARIISCILVLPVVFLLASMCLLDRGAPDYSSSALLKSKLSTIKNVQEGVEGVGPFFTYIYVPLVPRKKQKGFMLTLLTLGAG